jgi:hypothetical protein
MKRIFIYFMNLAFIRKTTESDQVTAHTALLQLNRTPMRCPWFMYTLGGFVVVKMRQLIEKFPYPGDCSASSLWNWL